MPTLIGCGAGTPELLRDNFCLRTCSVQRYACAKARYDLQADDPESYVSVFFIRVQNQRSKELSSLVVRSQGLRHYADDRYAAAIQIDLPSHNARICMKTSPPASVGEN